MKNAGEHLRKVLGLATRQKALLLAAVSIVAAWYVVSGLLVRQLERSYAAQSSVVIRDRSGTVLRMEQNVRGNFDQFANAVPTRVAELLLKKEDRYFYLHPGFNPVSVLRDLSYRVRRGRGTGSSTLTQQLVKVLLGNEQERGLQNKLKELAYALALESRSGKREILTMYLNSAYFGGQAQGLTEAASYYYGVPPENLSDAQTLALLATLNSPSKSGVGTPGNLERVGRIAGQLNVGVSADDLALARPQKTTAHRRNGASFELQSLDLPCAGSCALTVDADLTERVRDIVARNLASPVLETAHGGAVVVLKLPENELLALAGSPDPGGSKAGAQVNMAVQPRAIGSTAKPFMYVKAFEKGARPYTEVEDRELKYQIGNGFDFFPKNFDGTYRGTVTLHGALSNSLNVPSVQVLEYVGLEPFYRFLKHDLGFRPVQPLENYELSIALGGLEADPLTLAYYFSLFPNGGVLKPLTVYRGGGGSPFLAPPMADARTVPETVASSSAVQLINKILSDRDTGVEQFGMASSLNLPYKNYALKTGTSRDYHDSWTVGYTPDFLVAVWVGNSDGSAMREVTGLSGAARIWHDVMQLMYASPYSKGTPFDFSRVTAVADETGAEDFGLKGDSVEQARGLLLGSNLILAPHGGDTFLLTGTVSVPLEARTSARWSVNGAAVGEGERALWQPREAGSYTIAAEGADGKRAEVTVTVKGDDR